MTSIDTEWLHRANVPADARAVRADDLSALKSNWRSLSERVGDAECAAVVKANAYGVGDIGMRALAEAGCKTFFVASLEEGVRLRATLPDAVVYVLDGLLIGAEERYAEHRLRPCLSTLNQITAWAAFALRSTTRPAAAIHIDTGMSRLGLTGDDVEQLAAHADVLSNFALTLVLTHPACADAPDDPSTRAQFDAFNALRAKLPNAPASFANSPGIFHPGLALDLARPGIALYGGRPGVPPIPTLAPVVHVFARVLQVREISTGTPVGYGATFRAQRTTRIATLGFGYADGLHRSLGNLAPESRPNVWFGDLPAPIVGRISMDAITVDVTDLPDATVAEGNWAELIGPHQGVDDLADRIGTIGYEILTSLKMWRCRQVTVDGDTATIAPGDGWNG